MLLFHKNCFSLRRKTFCLLVSSEVIEKKLECKHAHALFVLFENCFAKQNVDEINKMGCLPN